MYVIKQSFIRYWVGGGVEVVISVLLSHYSGLYLSLHWCCYDNQISISKHNSFITQFQATSGQKVQFSPHPTPQLYHFPSLRTDILLLSILLE